MNKIRLDQRVFDLGLAESREKAKAVIMSGAVYLNGQKIKGTTIRYADIKDGGELLFVMK
jgi:ribosomal protein S4